MRAETAVVSAGKNAAEPSIGPLVTGVIVGVVAAILLVTLADPAPLRPACDELYVTLVEKGRPDLEDEIIREVVAGLAD